MTVNPSFGTQLKRFSTWTSIMLLLILLTGQIASLGGFFKVTQQNSPAISQILCEINLCNLVLKDKTDNFQIIQRDISESRQIPGVKNVSLTFTNASTHSRPFPAINLKFKNLKQEIVAQRTFLPSDYLAENVNLKQKMNNHSPYRFEMPIYLPNEKALTYEINFVALDLINL